MKNNDVNREAMIFDYGTSAHYEGSENEPEDIAKIKAKVVRKSLLQSEKKSRPVQIFRQLDSVKMAQDDIIRKARTSILHEDDDSIHTTRAERIRRAMREGFKVPAPASPERDPEDRNAYMDRL